MGNVANPPWHIDAVGGRSHHHRQLETTLHRYVWFYNQQLPQSALGSKTPLQAMKDWHNLKPKLFKKQPYYLPGCNSYKINSNIPEALTETSPSPGCAARSM
jgi:hypothetical protein